MERQLVWAKGDTDLAKEYLLAQSTTEAYKDTFEKHGNSQKLG